MTATESESGRSQKIVEDLVCFRCGYDLRVLEAGAQCPECGWPIAQSIDAIQNTAALARPIRLLACGHLMMMVPPPGFFVQLICVLVAAYGLRYRSGLQHRTGTAATIRWLWWCALAQPLCFLIAFVVDYVGQRMMAACAAILGCIVMAAAFLAMTRLAIILGRWLDHEPLVRGFQVLRGLAVVVWIAMGVVAIDNLLSAPQRPLLACVAAPLGGLTALGLFDLAIELGRSPAHAKMHPSSARFVVM